MNHYDDHGVGDLKAEIEHLNLVIERLTEQKKFHKERNDEWIKQEKGNVCDEYDTEGL